MLDARGLLGWTLHVNLQAKLGAQFQASNSPAAGNGMLCNGQSRKRLLPATDYETWLDEADDRDALTAAMNARSEAGSVVTDAEMLPLYAKTYHSRRMGVMGRFDADLTVGSCGWKFAFRDFTDNAALAMSMEQDFPFMKTATGVRIAFNSVGMNKSHLVLVSCASWHGQNWRCCWRTL